MKEDVGNGVYKVKRFNVVIVPYGAAWLIACEDRLDESKAAASVARDPNNVNYITQPTTILWSYLSFIHRSSPLLSQIPLPLDLKQHTLKPISVL